ncbi:MAG: class I SAM-dependent methyltransferase [Pseudomonadota bacterium]
MDEPIHVNAPDLVAKWNDWNLNHAPRYPNSVLVQHVYRHFGRDMDHSSIKVLDFGCGAGVNTFFFAENGFDTSGCDIADRALQRADETLSKQSLVARFGQLADFEHEKFDFLASVHVLECIPESLLHEQLARLFEMVATGGRGFFITKSAADKGNQRSNDGNLHGFTRDELVSLFALGLFEEVHIDTYDLTFKNGLERQSDWVVSFKASSI